MDLVGRSESATPFIKLDLWISIAFFKDYVCKHVHILWRCCLQSPHMDFLDMRVLENISEVTLAYWVVLGLLVRIL